MFLIMCTKQNFFNGCYILLLALKVVVGLHQNKNIESIADMVVSPGFYPALVFIQPVTNSSKGICIGSLISVKFVLTGKKCLTNLDESSPEKLSYDIIGGDVNYLNTSERSKTRVKIRGELLLLIDKPNYSTDHFALIYLLERVVINSNFRPIRIITEAPNEKQICTVIGIDLEAYKNNKMVSSFEDHNIIREADVIIVPLRICNGANSTTNNVTDVFCGESLETFDENKPTHGCFSGQLICNDQLAGIADCGTKYLEKSFACQYSAIPRGLTFFNEVEKSENVEIKRHLKINRYNNSPLMDFTPIYLLSIHLVIVHVLKL